MDERDKKLAKASADRMQAYQNVFSGPLGQKVLMDMIKTHHMMSSTFSGDVNQMLIREGERNVILRLLTILKIDVQGLTERIESYEDQ